MSIKELKGKILHGSLSDAEKHFIEMEFMGQVQYAKEHNPKEYLQFLQKSLEAIRKANDSLNVTN